MFSASIDKTKKIAVKRRKVFNNPELEKEVFCTMFKEFMISAPFKHPGIVENKYFYWRAAKEDQRETMLTHVGVVVDPTFAT